MLVFTILVAVLTAALAGIGYGIRGIARELDGMNGINGYDEKTRQDIEKWRDGK